MVSSIINQVFRIKGKVLIIVFSVLNAFALASVAVAQESASEASSGTSDQIPAETSQVDIPQAEWILVSGKDNLKELISGLVIERVWPDGSVSRGEYYDDGTGVLIQWGIEFPRRWEILGEDQICTVTRFDTNCSSIEQNVADETLFRLFQPEQNKWIEFKVIEGLSTLSGKPVRKRRKAGAASASASEVAAELTNPNARLGILTTLYDYKTFNGSVPGADQQTAQSITFQPSLPYPLGEDWNFFFRPAIPLVIEQPVMGMGGFEDKGIELGDISFDASLSSSFEAGSGKNVFLAGLAGSIPTATDKSVGSDQWLLGPEAGFTAVRKWGSAGLLLYHQWDVAGEDSFETNVSAGQYVYNINLKDGWQLTGSPTFSYNHEAASGDELTFPLAFGVARTVIFYGRPWTMSIEYWNYIESPDAFGAEHQIRFSIAPIVPLPW